MLGGVLEKGKILANDQEIPTPKKRGEKKMIIRYLYFKYRKPSEQLSSNRWLLSCPNLNENMKTYIRCKQHKNSTPKPKMN